MAEHRLTPSFIDGGGRPVYLQPPVLWVGQAASTGTPGWLVRCPNCQHDYLDVVRQATDTEPTVYSCPECPYEWEDA